MEGLTPTAALMSHGGSALDTIVHYAYTAQYPNLDSIQPNHPTYRRGSNV
jgi:hypothetical protein